MVRTARPRRPSYFLATKDSGGEGEAASSGSPFSMSAEGVGVRIAMVSEMRWGERERW
jgi:hypothetical protein